MPRMTTLLLLLSLFVPTTHASGGIVLYDFPDEGYSIELPSEWAPKSDPKEMWGLQQWSTEDGEQIEAMPFRRHTTRSVRLYVAKRDKDMRTNCMGKPSVTVRDAQWITVNGKRALRRLEHSCMVDRDFYTTYVLGDRWGLEFSSWNADRMTVNDRDLQLHNALLEAIVLTPTKS